MLPKIPPIYLFPPLDSCVHYMTYCAPRSGNRAPSLSSQCLWVVGGTLGPEAPIQAAQNPLGPYLPRAEFWALLIAGV